MTSEEAVDRITQHVLTTGLPAAEAVRELWSEISPISDPEPLMQFALAARVAVEYKRSAESDTPQPSISVRVQHDQRKPRIYSVSVQVLSDVHYNIGGKVKALIVMNASDLGTLAAQAQAAANGWKRYEEFFRYGMELLDKHHKKRITDLADADKLELARRFAGLKNIPSSTEAELAGESR